MHRYVYGCVCVCVCVIHDIMLNQRPLPNLLFFVHYGIVQNPKSILTFDRFSPFSSLSKTNFKKKMFTTRDKERR